MPDDDLSSRLLAEAESYDAAAHTRSLLGRHRRALLMARAKYMSYEQISAMLAKHGIDISPTAIGVFCRRNFTKAEILRTRREQERSLRTPPPDMLPGIISPPAHEATRSRQSSPPGTKPVTSDSGQRGPRIARDDI